MLSLFSLVSLIGVMLGVTVLVVVMSVYSGLERDVKQRLLGFTPHVLLQRPDPESPDGRMNDWREAVKIVERLPQVQAVTAFVSDNVIIDVNSGQRPVMLRGIDSTDPAQVEGLKRMLDLKGYPDSSADMGLDDRVVISSIVAEQYGLKPGDKIRLYSTRNFEEVMRVYKATENPPVRVAFAADWQPLSETLKKAWKADGDQFTLDWTDYRPAYNHLLAIYSQPLRKPEYELLTKMVDGMDESEKVPAPGNPDDDPAVFHFTKESKEKVTTALESLESTDEKEMDAETFKSLKSVILPKEAQVAGVYRASMMAVTPDIFMPLHLAQNLAGLGDAVQGIAARLDDPYRAEMWAAESRKALGPDWALVTWGEQARPFFLLIEQQRGMMYLVLSMIVLISAFSMMAVMFTITIQKRREIGVMKALGAAPGQIVRVFLYQGMILGTLGAILGIALGRLIICFRGELQATLRTVGFDPFSSSLTGFDTLPAYNNPVEQLLFGVMAFVLCSLAALVPAFFAARSDAAKSLRNL